ncbi:allatostatin-A receptor-like [Littorina saxatilis]|uniref:allatostatin-A receptor-like n=1 Tax=Littorina saxatilis TaxID=31220 RepID=UPI0038B41DF1
MTMPTTTMAGGGGGGGGGGKQCVPGDPSETVTFPPELLANIDSFFPIRVIHREEVAFKVTFYVLAMLLDVIGNSLVIFIVAASKKMRTPTNVLLVNLAVADLLIGVVCMWVHLGDSITQDWPFGLGICKVNMFAQVTLITTSVLTLTVLSIGRFLAIVFPLRRGGWTLKMTWPIIFVIWVIACGIASPQLHVRHLEEYRFRNRHVIKCTEVWDEVYLNEQCDEWKPSEMIYHLFVSVVMFFVPIVVMIVCYSVISVSLLTRKGPGGQQPSDSQSRSKRRVVRMLVILLVVFVFCWTPAHVLDLIPVFDKEHEMDRTVSYVALYIGYLNSALNPILYAGFNDNFRRGFKEVFSCGCLPFKKVGSRVRPEFRRRTETVSPTRGQGLDSKQPHIDRGTTDLEQPDQHLHLHHNPPTSLNDHNGVSNNDGNNQNHNNSNNDDNNQNHNNSNNDDNNQNHNNSNNDDNNQNHNNSNSHMIHVATIGTSAATTSFT